MSEFFFGLMDILNSDFKSGSAFSVQIHTDSDSKSDWWGS